MTLATQDNALQRVAEAIRERHALDCIDTIVISEACRQLCLKHAEVPKHVVLVELLNGNRLWLCLFFVEMTGQVIEHYSDVNVLYLNIPSTQLL
jgi:hypothetical protein